MGCKKKIVLVSALNYNFGSVLQSFAFQHILNEKGIDAKIINYKKKISLMQLLRITNLALVKVKLLNIRKKIYIFTNSDRKEWWRKKDINYKEFIELYINTTPVITGYKLLRKFITSYDVVIVGSDQLWNPMNNGTHFATVEFAPKNIVRYSYATSFGVTNLKKRDISLMKKVLPTFRMISVREQQGAKIINSILGNLIDVHVDLDPTILIDGLKWENILNLDIKRKGEKYILGYFISSNEKYRELIDSIAESKGLHLIVLPHIDQYVRADEKYEEYEVCSAGPIEFLNFIRNAEYVVTDSFHGTVFSILFKKRFCVLDRFARNDLVSMNSRIDNLLSTVDLVERHANSIEDILDVLNKDINFPRVYNLLQVQREKSLKYIDSILTDIGEK